MYAIAGPRWVDRARIYFQERIMRYLSKSAARAILPVPVDSASWLSALSKSIFIPIGANIPSLDDLAGEGFVPVRDAIPTVAVFGVTTWPAAQIREVEAIVHAVRHACAKVGEMQLLVLGRGAKEAEPLLRDRLAGSCVRLRVQGLCSQREISASLAASDVLLFVRGALSTRRGSGLAGIACGVPIVAYQGIETAWPLTQAGIVFVRQDDFVSLGNQLSALLLDRKRQMDLSARNRVVFREWFSWGRIAERWIEALGAARPGAVRQEKRVVTR
jgi:glycosyltransferase involved in cell wall biosynthesis